MSLSAAKPWLAHYAPGVVAEIPTVTESLPEMIARTAREFPDHVALEFFGAETRYGQLAERIARAAEGLRRLGVVAGDRVALVLPNCPEHIIAFYAVLRLGAVAVEHNPLYTPRELTHQFADHGARFAIVWDKLGETVLGFAEELGLISVVSLDITAGMRLSTRIALRLPVKAAREGRARLTAGGHAAGTVPWARLLADGPLGDDVPLPKPGDLAVIQYTSGTTGTPKGAMLSHANLLMNTQQCQAWLPERFDRGTAVVYAILPVFHAYGLTLSLTFAMSIGARLVLFPAFDPDLVLAAHAKHPATFLPAVPPIYVRLLARAREKGIDLSGIGISVSGGMSLDPAMIDTWEAATGGTLVEGYGLSETSPILMINPLSQARQPGSIGVPVSSTSAKIVDPEDASRELAAGEAGELLVAGPQVFSGYWGKPEETAAVLQDGWFRTGDIAVMGEDGFLRIVDRIKELIITGGFNVSPSEVEDAVVAQPGIAEAAVVGMPDTHSGEQVVAAVVLEPGASFDEAALRSALRDSLTPYKVPRRIVVVDELPRNLIGKVLRREVKQLPQLTGDAVR